MKIVTREPQALEPLQYDVAFALPSCAEGRGVLHMLHSIAVQEGIDDIRMLIALVINHQKGASPDTAASNAVTHEFVQQLWSGKAPEDLANDTTIFLTPQLQELNVSSFNEIVEALQIRRRIEIVLVDMHTGDNAPEHCNVGIARKVGCETAIPCLKPDGILVTSDADSWLDRGFVHSLRTLYTDTSVQAATGDVTYMPTLETLNVDKLRDVEAYLRSAQILTYRILHPDYSPNTGVRDVTMPGVCMTMRPEVYREIGGFDPMAGGEDIALSCKILKRGHTIHDNPAMRVFTPTRVSLRTHEHHGLGQAIARKMAYSDAPNEFPVGSLHAVFFIEQLNAHLEASRTANNETEWHQRMSKFRLSGVYTDAGDQRAVLSEEEISLLWREYQRVPNISHVIANDFIWAAIRDMSKARFPDTRLDVALLHVQSVLENSEDDDGTDHVSRLLELFKKNENVLKVLRDYADQRIQEDGAQNANQERVSRVRFGRPINATDATIQELTASACNLRWAAQSKYCCGRIALFAGRLEHVIDALGDAADTALPSGYIPRELIEPLRALCTMLEDALLVLAAGSNLLDRGHTFGSGIKDDDAAAIKKPLCERITLYEDGLKEAFVTIDKTVVTLAICLPALLRKCGTAREQIQQLWDELLEYRKSAREVSKKWRVDVDRHW